MYKIYIILINFYLIYYWIEFKVWLNFNQTLDAINYSQCGMVLTHCIMHKIFGLRNMWPLLVMDSSSNCYLHWSWPWQYPGQIYQFTSTLHTWYASCLQISITSNTWYSASEICQSQLLQQKHNAEMHDL